MKYLLRGAIVSITFGVASLAQAGVVTFTDSIVNPASYLVKIYNTDPSVTIAISATAAGNPGPALQIQYTNSGGAVALDSYESFTNSAFTYNPLSQGAIQTVNFSNDRFVDVGSILNPSLTVFSRPTVLQNGKYYFSPYLDPQVRGAFYTSASPGPLNSLNFSLFDFVTGVSDPLQHPDFSAAGSAISFGFTNRFSLNTRGTPFSLDALFKFDNISITVNGVPEPSEISLMFLGLAALGVSMMRRQRAPGGEEQAGKG